MNVPRFVDADFIPPSEKVQTEEPESTLGISERGMELLQKINEIIDLVEHTDRNGSQNPIVLQFTE